MQHSTRARRWIIAFAVSLLVIVMCGLFPGSAHTQQINERARAGHQVTRVDRTIGREVNDGVAIRVAAAEISGAHLFAAQENRCFLRERDFRGNHVR